MNRGNEPTNGGSAPDFIRAIIAEDLRTNKHGGRVATRFPPEPNGYLHIGHAKAICLDFGIATEIEGATCNLRFDDTNPVKEDPEYVEAIQRDVRWLGFEFGEPLYASDYFSRMYECAEKLIQEGKAYVCDLDDEQIRQYRGSLSEPGKPSPFRDRSVAENLDLFRRMRAGEFPDGARVLRAKIDMAAPNMKMRDPLLYRIRHTPHDRTGDAWCIYPMYDFAHPLSDAFEHITHSLCTLEFENNRELYDWVIDNCDVPHQWAPGDVRLRRPTDLPSRPRQIEFARLSLGYTVMSKRKLLRLVQEGEVSGWDDPRMPTLAAMRRRGYTPEAIRSFCDLIGVAKHNSTVDIGKLEYAVRDDLNQRAPRVMCVLRPLRVELTNYQGKGEELEAPSFPADVGKPGTRKVPFGRTLFIEASDFSPEPPAGYKRLAPGRVVRLRHAYCIRCDEVIEEGGRVVGLRCSYLPETGGGANPEGEKVWGVIHWVAESGSLPAKVRLYDRLFTVEKPDAEPDFQRYLNPQSLEVIDGARVEPSVAGGEPGSRYQFERLGYFVSDIVDSKPDALVFNRIVTLRDSWASKKEVVAAPPKASEAPSKRDTRPARRSPVEIRAEARNRDPELAARYKRYQDDHGLDADSADLLSGERAPGDLFEATIAAGAPAGEAAKWIINELPRVAGDGGVAAVRFGGAELAALIAAVEAGTISSKAAKVVLGELAESGGEVRAIIADKGLAQVSDAASIEPLVAEVLDTNPDKVDAYRAGKTGLLGFFVGQVMKASRGAANPELVNQLLRDRLEA